MTYMSTVQEIAIIYVVLKCKIAVYVSIKIMNTIQKKLNIVKVNLKNYYIILDYINKSRNNRYLLL